MHVLAAMSLCNAYIACLKELFERCRADVGLTFFRDGDMGALRQYLRNKDFGVKPLFTLHIKKPPMVR
jgi:hypothetical protein